jgi:hypothetical protein
MAVMKSIALFLMAAHLLTLIHARTKGFSDISTIDVIGTMHALAFIFFGVFT